MTIRSKAVALAAAALFALPVLAACSSDDGGSAKPTGTPTMLGVPQPGVPNPPSDTSVDAGFARDMKVHHAQAVEMSFVVRDATQDEATRRLAYDILTAQQNQIGQMTGWLSVWGLSQTTMDPPMKWMSPAGMTAMSGHSMAPGMTMAPDPNAPLMPGMATKDQMDKLATLKGREAEVMFLQLMITHHQAGVAMAQDAVDHATTQVVKDLAKSMVNGQLSEIDLMRGMLTERGA
ncbi:DUF305 domain-containing protein [Yinghuangia seranimata]|uniref:DUF305 domain-containing protein n=1 Tax=Yinghuangia seranimata TaxID=408067 RepID=UPI00248B9C97|nr:DUF305 domain-containing protein [Yinghuangia seranimata]MDI2132689.1 DUF305 domain-containing protein [Yinghuangia seranimata]